MSRYNIQLNKTSRNSVLLQSNINNTRSDIAHLIRMLVEISSEIEQRLAQGGPNVRQEFDARVKSLMTDLPDLPNFAAPYLGAKIASYDVGSAAGLYAGSQTISASMGLATDAINRLGLSPEETKKLLDGMPVAYAVTYIFGTVGSAIVLALIGPALLGIDLEAACKRYEEKHGARRNWAVREQRGTNSNCVRFGSGTEDRP